MSAARPVTERRFVLDSTTYRVLAVDAPGGGVILVAPDFHWSGAGYGRGGVSEEWLRNQLAGDKVRAGDRRNLARCLLMVYAEHFTAPDAQSGEGLNLIGSVGSLAVGHRG